MGKLKYYFKRLFGMNYKKMIESINIIHKRSGKSRIIIFFDMINCSIKYLSGYMDYLIFNFEELSSKERSTFVTRGINNDYIKTMNNREFYDKFDNKVIFNELFSKYIKRDFVYLENNLDEFKKFVKKHAEFLVKPLSESCGKGIEKIKINENDDIDLLYQKLIDNGQLLVEEYVHQKTELNNLFPHSVNTIRLVTIRKNKPAKIVFRCIRIGNGKNVVDNFNHGGMYSIIDENGIISKPAIDKNGNIYKIHPVTNTNIEGFQIPFFKEACEMVIEASEVIKEVGYIGWDISITESGPVMIEGNQLPGYDLYQSKAHLNKDKIGLKPIFDEAIYGKINKKNRHQK